MSRHYLLSILFFLFAACEPLDTGGAEADLAPRHTQPCLAGIDEDGDGSTDYFSLQNPVFRQDLDAEQCRASGGTPFEQRRRGSALSPSTDAAPAATQDYPQGASLPMSIRIAVANAGVHNRHYQNPSYDCDDFANALEVALGNAGYNATFTEICQPGMPDDSWHAVTDVHVDGVTYWIDAQTGKEIKLDQDGNGQVTTSTSGKPCARTSEGTFGIRVWDNLRARINELGSPDLR
jgi:hypothetical protein